LSKNLSNLCGVRKPCRVSLLGFIVIVIAATTNVLVFRSGDFSPPGTLVEEARFQEYHVKVYYRNLEGFREKMFDRLPTVLSDLSYRMPGLRAWSGVEILRAGRRVFSSYGASLTIARFGSNDIAGIDITGAGIPNVALTDRHGRLGGGVLHLFECGKTLRLIATIESLGEYPTFQDIDHDGIPELTASDDAFYHFPTPRDGQPMPTVILRWRDGKYIPAKDIMVKAPPPEDELNAVSARMQLTAESDDPAELSDQFSATVLNLLYSGHEDLAWRFVDASLTNLVERTNFIAELRSRLEQSTYWPDLR
jgi:hypothetical protein